jgi:hypothetical protein
MIIVHCAASRSSRSLLGVYLGGSGGDKSIINGVGGPVTSTSNPGIGVPVSLVSYP